MKNTHGGKRPNSGRPKGRKKYKQIRLSVEVFDALNAQKKDLSWDKFLSLLAK